MLAVKLAGLFLALWAASAFIFQVSRKLSFHQAALYIPLKIIFRISDRSMMAVREAKAPVVYAIWHGSRLEPALMLSLLPDDTLHILDDRSAKSAWLEPWRAMARSIAFNAHHVFVSRRLVQRLKGKGRLAVYLPDDTDPDTKSFRLFRAVARIAAKADAHVIPVYVERTGFLPARTLRTLPPMTIDALLEQAEDGTRASEALFKRMMEARPAAAESVRQPEG